MTVSTSVQLDMHGIGMRFGAIWVLRNVDYQVTSGSIHALVGHNGAGKSTLMKIALGAHAPTEGTVAIGGTQLASAQPAEAHRLGLGMVMQERSLIGTLSGLDNIFLGAERVNRVTHTVKRRREMAEAERLCEDLRISPALLPRLVSDMTAVQQQMLEIAKAVRLARNVLILDEPTAPLSHREVDALFEVIRRATGLGVGIVYISHHLSEVFAISDRVTCLREGTVSLSTPTSQTSLPELVEAMLGRPQTIAEAAARRAPRTSEPAVTVTDLQVGDKLHSVSFDIGAGEIVGVAGLVGSGRTTLLRALFGDARITGGTVKLRDRPFAPTSTSEAIARGVYLIPESRAQFGLVSTQSIVENVRLPVIRRLTRLGFLQNGAARRLARDMMRRLQIRARDHAQLVGELSGGNQQKVVLAKALATKADLMLLDEPTYGVDIGAAAEVIRQVRDLAQAGKAVLWATSDLQELLAVADRVLVLGDGTIRHVVERGDDEFSEAFLIQAMQRRRDPTDVPEERSA